MKDFTILREVYYVDGCYRDCINRWTIKRVARRLFPYGTEMKRLKVTYLGKMDNGFCSYNIYKVVSPEGECRFIGLNYTNCDGGFYYELREE